MTKPIYTNTNNISMSVAVWLMNDNYDYNHDPNYLSATTLLKPTRMIILGQRSNERADLSDLVTSRIGSAVHDSIEKAWSTKDLPKALSAIGFPKEIAKRIKVNPKELKEGDIPVYIEQRGYLKYGDYTIGGKFDICIDGCLEDFKNTSVYTYIFGGRDSDYIKQGSIYRAIFPDKITKNVIKINYIFKDFVQSQVGKSDNYPPSQVLQQEYPLMSPEATKRMIFAKVDEIAKYRNAEEADLPLCPQDELWMAEKTYAYYKNGISGRATKVYDNLEEAEKRKAMEGSGVIQVRGGEPKRCDYCAGRNICSQYKKMMENLKHGK